MHEFNGWQCDSCGELITGIVGPNGLMMLFSLLAAGSLPQSEILELGKRVQIPGYDLARSVLQAPTSLNVVAQFPGRGCYLQSEIREIIALASDYLLKSRVKLQEVL